MKLQNGEWRYYQSMKSKRPYCKIRRSLLKTLATGQKNTNELAKISNVNWKTTRNHIIFLVGMGYARRVFDSPQVKIVEITDKGANALATKKI
jgi:predicted transcriptional regulator